MSTGGDDNDGRAEVITADVPEPTAPEPLGAAPEAAPDRSWWRRWARRLILPAIVGLGLLAGLDAVVVNKFNLDAVSFATDTFGWSDTRFEGSFESGKVHCRWCNPDGWVVQNRVDHPDSMVVGRDFPQRDGEYSLGIRAERDWPWNLKPRIEISSHDHTFFEKNTEYWIAWSIYLPDDGSYEFDSQMPEVLLQVHGDNDGCDEGGMGPPHALRPLNGRWRWDVRWDPERCMSSTPLGREVIDMGPQELGRWTDFVARFVFSHGDDGVTQVWRDGELLVDRVDMPNHYNNAKGPYVKLGFYKADWVEGPTDVESRTLYIDAIRVYEGPDGFDEVHPDTATDADRTFRRVLPIVLAILLGLAAGAVLYRRAQ